MGKRRESAVCERIKMRVRFDGDGNPLCPQHENGRCKASGDRCLLLRVEEPRKVKAIYG